MKHVHDYNSPECPPDIDDLIFGDIDTIPSDR